HFCRSALSGAPTVSQNQPKCYLAHREFVDRGGFIGFARSQHRRRPIGFIGRVREVLCFQRAAVTLPVEGPAWADPRLCHITPLPEVVAAIDLQPWLSGPDLQRTPQAR